MTTRTTTTFIVHNFSDDDKPGRLRGRSMDNPLKPSVGQLAFSHGKVKLNSAPVMEPISRSADRQKFDTAIARAQLGLQKQTVDLSKSLNVAARRG